MTTTAETAQPLRAGGLWRVVIASMIGTTIEWYDFFLYGSSAALVFNKLFFPKADPLVGAMLAFATYALGFVARPIGGIVFGHFGDRIGRKKLLMASLMIMGGSTVLIGVLPTYAQLGVAAPLLLILLRLAQGFAVGGEWGGAVLLVAEHGDAKRRGFWTGWPQAGVAAGSVLASGALAAMTAFQSEADFVAWGWRIPFLLSAVLIAVGWWVRSTIEESPAFKQVAAEAKVHRAPILAALRSRPRGVLLGIALRIAENLSYYVVSAFSITYLTEVLHVPRAVALNALMIGAAIQFCTIPMFAALSDRIGRRPVYGVGVLGMGVWGFVFFRLLQTREPSMILLAVVVALLMHAAMYGTQAAFLAEIFPTRIRYSGISLASQVSSVFAGALAPIVALALLKQTGSATPVAIYVAAGCAISLIATLLARETRGETFAELDERHG
jgi:metabolite-proton symporter